MRDDAIHEDEAFVREGGVFAPKSGGRDVGCESDELTCPTDDVLEDPVNDEHLPGTVDDAAFDYGTIDPAPTDQRLGTIETGPVVGMRDPGMTGYDEDVQESPLGAVDERDLWKRQKGLIDEDEAQPYTLSGFSDEEVEGVERALGEDAAGPLVDSPEGTSATGSSNSE